MTDEWSPISDVVKLRTGDMVMEVTDHDDSTVTIRVTPQVEGIALVEPMVEVGGGAFTIRLEARVAAVRR
jgi:hypothetical protein